VNEGAMARWGLSRQIKKYEKIEKFVNYACSSVLECSTCSLKTLFLWLSECVI
jgi:hypothetical protein